MLTGKCKKDFRKWLNDNHRYAINYFDNLHPSLKFGFYQDFFYDSELYIHFVILVTRSYQATISNKKNEIVSSTVIDSDKSKVIIEIIQQANSLYNANIKNKAY